MHTRWTLSELTGSKRIVESSTSSSVSSTRAIAVSRSIDVRQRGGPTLRVLITHPIAAARS
jgi:hypothetical protein